MCLFSVVRAAPPCAGPLPLLLLLSQHACAHAQAHVARITRPTHITHHNRWRELPPGHYISGRKLYQFALTPHQLALRELNEADELGSSASGSGGRLGLSGAHAGHRALGISGGGGGGGACYLGLGDDAAQLAAVKSGGSRRSLDNDVFCLDV
jgi:hypothetical protein